MRNWSVRSGWAVIVSLLVVAALSGCGATKVQQAWRDEAYRGGKPEKVLIISMMSNQTVQREMESQFARRFRERGIDATESFRVLSVDQLPAGGAKDAVVAKIRELKIDAVLIVRRAAARTEKSDIPGMTITHGMSMGYGGWGGTTAVIASSAPMAPTTQAYSHDTKFLGMEAQLYDAQTEKLVWFLQTETRLSGPPQEEIKPYVSLVAKKLFNERIF